FTCSIIVIYQYKGLVYMHACIAKAFSLPATLFNKPSGGQFGISFFSRKGYNVRMLTFYFFKLNISYYRIFKKATRITNFIRVRQFARTYFNYSITYVLNSRIRNTLIL